MGINKVWYEPNGVLNHEGPTEDSIKFILDGKFLLHSSKRVFEDKSYEGSRIISYNDKEGKYKSSWIDTFHNGLDIMIQEGFDPANLSVLGSYSDRDEEWGWCTVFEMPNDDELIISHYNIPAGGPEYLGVESRLKRT